MNVISRPRQSGKTTDAIKLAAEHKLTIMCHTYDRAKQVGIQAKHMGLDIPEPKSWNTPNYTSNLVARSRNIIIEDVDILLHRLFQECNIHYITISDGENPHELC